MLINIINISHQRELAKSQEAKVAFLGSPMGRGIMLVSLALIRHSWYRVMRTNYQRGIQVKQDTTNMLAATTAAANIREKVKYRILGLLTYVELFVGF